MSYNQENTFSQYQIICELGRGGMGVVYKAFDRKLQRYVALKVINKANVSHTMLQRFLREVQTVASLQHQNIVQIFDRGTTPQPYFTMEYIDGATLKTRLNKLQFQFEEVARIFIQICRALQEIHGKNVIHRDIKPDNIMLAANNEPKLMDFGLAKQMQDLQSLSQQGDVIGTPYYMSPEQAMSEELDFQTDIYSLGATLYEVLTLRPPFSGKLYVQVAYNVVENDPVSPRMLNNEIPSDLELICLKCLEKSKGQRYQSVDDLICDLENFLAHRPISIKSEKLYRLKKWCYRHKLLSIFCVFFVLFLMVVVFFSYEKWLTNKELEKLNTQLRIEKQTKEQALLRSQQQLLDAHIKMAEYQYYERNIQSAYEEMRKAQMIQNAGLSQQQYVDLFMRYSIEPLLMEKKNTKEFPKANAEYTQYKYTRKYVCVKSQNRIYVWNCDEKKYVAENAILKFSPGIFAIKNNTFVHYDGATIRIVDLSTQKSQDYRFVLSGSLIAIAYYGNWLAIKTRSKLIFYDFANKQGQSFDCRRTIANQITPQFFNDGKSLMAGIESSIGLWRLVNGKEWKLQRSFSFLGRNIESSVISPLEKQILYGDRSGNIHIVDLQDNTTSTFRKHSASVIDIAFSDDGRFFVSADKDGCLVVWSTLSQMPLKVHHLHKKIVHVAFDTPQYLNIIVDGHSNGVIQKWCVEKGSRALHIQDRKKTITSVLNNIGLDSAALFPNPIHVSPNKKYVAFVYRSAVSLWNANDGKHQIFLVDENWLHPEICSYRFSPDSNILAILYRNGRLVVISAQNLNVIHDSKVEHIQKKFYQDGFLTFSPQGDLFFLIKLQEQSFRIFKYDVAKNIVVSWCSFPEESNAARFNSEGDIAVGTIKGNVHIFPKGNLTSKPITINTQMTETVKYIAWSEDCRKIFIWVRNQENAVVFSREKDEFIFMKNIPTATRINFAQFLPGNENIAVFEHNHLYIYNLRKQFRVELLRGYYKGGLATMSKDCKWLAFPSLQGQVIMTPVTFR